MFSLCLKVPTILFGGPCYYIIIFAKLQKFMMWDNCCYPCYYFQGYIIISVVIFLFHIRPFWCEVELDIDVTLTLDILWLRNSIYLGQIHFIFFVFFSDTFSRLYYKHCTFNLLSKNINWCLFNLWMFKNCSFSNFLIFSVT